MQDSLLDIDVIIEQPVWLERFPALEEDINTICEKALQLTGIMACIPHIELSVTLTDDSSIRKLNSRYRDKDKATNVLSFPNEAITPPYFKDVPTYEGYLLLGDIVLSLETLESEAQEQGKTLKAHFTHLLVHGLLHLLGYDHETEEEATLMEQLETDILAYLAISSPYEASIE